MCRYQCDILYRNSSTSRFRVMFNSSAASVSLNNERSLGDWCDTLVRFLTCAPITLLVIIASVLAFVSETLTKVWQLDTFNMSAWTFFTGHMTHWSFDQLFWDVLAFAVLGYLCEQTGCRRMLAVLLLSSFAVSASVLLVHPDLASYRGLSGVDSALFAYMACFVAETGFRNHDRAWLAGGVIAWLVFVGKVIFELWTGQTLFVEAAGGFHSLPISHVAGALSGSLVWLVATVAARGSAADRPA